VHPIDWEGPAPLAGSPAATGGPAAAWVAAEGAAGDTPATAASSTAAVSNSGSSSSCVGSASATAAHQDSSQQLLQQQQQWSGSSAAACRCAVIYKKGDDLRQDQFILQVCWGHLCGELCMPLHRICAQLSLNNLSLACTASLRWIHNIPVMAALQLLCVR